MKPKFFALVGFLVAVIALEPSNARPTHAEQFMSDSDNNFVVIGAFAVQSNAVKFTSNANKMPAQLKGEAAYKFNPERNLFYVYVLETADREKAISEANRIRIETPFLDTWVYQGSFTKSDSESISKGVDINPVTENNITDVKTSDGTGSVNNTIIDSNELMASTSTSSSSEESVALKPDDANGKNFFFKLYRAVDNVEVAGDVNAIDSDRARKMGTYKGNIPVRVSSPLNKSGEISLVCEVFGYRKVQRNFDYGNPVADDISSEDNKGTVVPFELVRLQKGDIAVMYNVYFFKDAGIMRPESRYEINSLLEMMKENPKYKIKIHGHTNGGAAGKIISIGESKDFFSLTGTVESIGTAKKLSKERADVIKKYLLDNGIEATRMEIKAWGGKRPIHDKLSNRAQENVRVEIEILQN
jgi:outer membrane protein OmpA-like peptidoglycan-associated protein